MKGLILPSVPSYIFSFCFSTPSFHSNILPDSALFDTTRNPPIHHTTPRPIFAGRPCPPRRHQFRYFFETCPVGSPRLICSRNGRTPLDRPLNTHRSDTIIYEIHVRRFTRHPSSGVAHHGTFQGVVERTPYLTESGITAVELMPVTEFNENDLKLINPMTNEQLVNLWGYDPISFSAPKASHAENTSVQGALDSFKQMVNALHEAGKVEVTVALANDKPFIKEEDPELHRSCMLCFSVQDTGFGIPSNRQDMISEAFSQGDTSTTRRFGGTGLGLSIVSQLIHLMGGDIWLESEEERGRTFSCTIQARLAEITEEPLAFLEPAINVLIPDLHILIAEDNPVNQYFTAALLKRYGCSVELVHNGQQALDAITQKAFDLVFMDVEMPVMNGLETTRYSGTGDGFRSSHPDYCHDAHAMAGDRERCIEAGMDEYLTKPIHTAGLLKEIKITLSLDEETDDSVGTWQVCDVLRTRV